MYVNAEGTKNIIKRFLNDSCIYAGNIALNIQIRFIRDISTINPRASHLQRRVLLVEFIEVPPVE